MKPCTQCKKEFEITVEDKAFYQKMNVLEPVLCPDCRHQQRVAWRNERTLYANICGLCKKALSHHILQTHL